MSGASVYGAAVAAVSAMWAARWPSPAGVPVRWHSNTDEQTPSRADTLHWLHLSVEFEDEAQIAFAAGAGGGERELSGTVVVRVLAARGAGETACLELLDAALGVFRSQRSGPLSFIGSMALQQPGASDDGAWWIRSGICAFTYRFRG